MSEKARTLTCPSPTQHHPCLRPGTGTRSSGILTPHTHTHQSSSSPNGHLPQSPLPGLTLSPLNLTTKISTLQSLSSRTLSPNFYPSSLFPFTPKHFNIRGSGAQAMLPRPPLHPQRAPISGRIPFCLQHVTDALATGLSSADLAAGACGGRWCRLRAMGENLPGPHL